MNIQMFDDAPEREEFAYWFTYVGISANGDRLWSISHENDPDNKPIGTVIEQKEEIELVSVTGTIPEFDSSDVSTCFNKFKRRPEYYVYDFERIYKRHDGTAVEMYKMLLIGCILIRVPSANIENLAISIDKMFSWLNSTDFYVAPASTKYHGAESGGLLKHTLKVVYLTMQLLHSPIWQDKINVASAILTALVHDWCKIGRYESYLKNVKNEDTGIWEKQNAYKLKDTQLSCLGHGVSSMFLAERFFRLSVEEAAAIRWHMGEYNVADNEMDELHQANETYPLVQLLQFADRLSITRYL